MKFLQVNELIRKGAFDQALEQSKQLVHFNPNIFADMLTNLYRQLAVQVRNNRLRFLICELYIDQNYFEDAVLELEEAYEIDPSFSQIYFLLSKIYNRNGQNHAIKNIFEDAFQKKIYDSAILDLLPKIYIDQKEYSKGIYFYEVLTQQHPHNVGYRKTLAELYIKDKQYFSAANIYQEMISKNPESKLEVIQNCERLIQVAPRNVEIEEMMIHLFLKAHKPIKAVELIRKYIDFHSNCMDKGIDFYKKALTLYPQTNEILLGLAQALTLKESYSEAVSYLKEIQINTSDYFEAIQKVLEQILSKFPNQIMALMLMADIKMRQKEFTDALNCLEILIELDPQEINEIEERVEDCLIRSKEHHFEGQLLIAKILLHRENFQGALTLAEEFKGSKIDLEGRILRAKVYEKAKRYSNCYKELFDAIKHYTYHIEVHQYLKEFQNNLIANEMDRRIGLAGENVSSDQLLYRIGLLALRRGSIYLAIEYFQKIQETAFLRQQAQVLIGRCFMELGRFDLSINQLQRDLDAAGASNLNLANPIRFLLAMNLINVGDIHQALKHLNSIWEVDIKYPRINTVIKRYQETSFVDLRGKAISLSYSYIQDKAFQLISVPNLEGKENKRRKKEWMTISFSLQHNNQGVEYVLNENLKAGEDAFLLAIQMDPALTISFCNIAVFYMLNSNFDLATDYLDKALALNSSLDIVYLNFGCMYMIQKKWRLAKEQFKKALTHNPGNFLAMLNLGDVYAFEQDLKRAFSYWQQAATFENIAYQVQRRIRYLQRESLGFNYWISHFDVKITAL